MDTTTHRRPSLAGTTAVIALVVALASPAHAAYQELVGTADLANNAVTSPKIADSTIQRRDLAPAVRPNPPRALEADRGGSVTVSSSGITVLALTLPVGTWLVMAKGYVSMGEASAQCDLVAAGTIWDRIQAGRFVDFDPNTYNGSATLPFMLEQRIPVSASTSVQLVCRSNPQTAVADTKILAVRVTA